jgi:hypothetical protein
MVNPEGGGAGKSRHDLILTVGYYHARRRGMSDDDANDCAKNFLILLMTTTLCGALHAVLVGHLLTSAHMQALHRAADNYANNTVRRQRAESSHFVCNASNAQGGEADTRKPW